MVQDFNKRVVSCAKASGVSVTREGYVGNVEALVAAIVEKAVNENETAKSA
jgi:hypothetical protein